MNSTAAAQHALEATRESQTMQASQLHDAAQVRASVLIRDLTARLWNGEDIDRRVLVLRLAEIAELVE